MKIEITRKFRKQIEDFDDQKIKGKISEIIKEVVNSEDFREINNLKKLTGYKNYQ